MLVARAILTVIGCQRYQDEDVGNHIRTREDVNLQ